MKIISIEEFRNRKNNVPFRQPAEEKKLKFPKPDRSGLKPNSGKDIDLAWGEGSLSNGRPFRMECWAAYQCTFLTFFMSTSGLEEATNQDLKQLMISEQIAVFHDEEFNSSGYGGCNVEAKKEVDDSGNEMWSITVIVGDEDGTYASNVNPLVRYDK